MSSFVPTPEQKAILGHSLDKHARVLAGPGTGKSATLVAFLDRLLEQKALRRIKMLTFTRAATSELAKKVSAHPAAAEERPSTIHSFAISILLMNPGAGSLPQPLRMADNWEYDNIVRPSLARRVGVKVKTLDKLVTELESNWQSLRPEDDPRIDPKDRGRFLGAWNEHREIFGYTLLAELPYALRNALQNHPDLIGVDFELLIVDEYQDLNACDLGALKLIADRGCTIIGAGDDDQSIYHFRKAAPEGIRRFLNDYPGADDYPLSITQRCGSKIIEWASYVIGGDPDRPKMRPPLKPAEGSPVGECALLSFADENEEALGVASLIQRLVDVEKVPPQEILVLLRADYNEAFSKPLKAALREAQVPFSDPEAIMGMLGEPCNRQLIEVFRVLVHREDSLAWAGLLRLSGGIGDSFFDYIYKLAREKRIQFGYTLLAAYAQGFPGGPSGSSRTASELIKRVSDWLDAHLETMGEQEGKWGAWMLRLAQGRVVPSPTPEFGELLVALDDLAEAGHGLGRYLSQIAPLGKDRAQAESQGIRIMTMGAAKGLTVQATIIMALEDGIVPRPDCDLGEERRLLYVAMTRARRYLFASWVRKRRGQTAWSGKAQVGQFRRFSQFLDGSPVKSEDGSVFLHKRWKSTA
jgi:DNA helicase-2/ATP-dependent DNA helicase PcrA